jgi:Kef-type K+ transport system membrane component KefB
MPGAPTPSLNTEGEPSVTTSSRGLASPARCRVGFRLVWIVVALLVLLAPTVGLHAANSMHSDPTAHVVLWLALVLLAALVGGDLAARVGQPAVLGELLVGVVLGNLAWLGWPGLEPIKTDPSMELVAGLGVLLLLFEVGLKSTVSEMLHVGKSAVLVATLGVIGPFALGCGVGAWLLPGSNVYVHAFLGATLTATSVGITARVLRDLGRSRSPEARVILGAAVVDDVLGLVILAAVTGVIAAAGSSAPFSYATVFVPLLKAAAFLVGTLVIGALVSHRLFSLASRLRARGVLLALGLSFCFLLSWLASQIGLAAIVGAFAAGLLLEHTHYDPFVDRGERGLEELIQPISSFLAPVFFVLMGMRTNLAALGQPEVLGLGAALIVAAIVGKQACSLGVLGRGVDRLTVGLGMVPRGEVGLIFANIGLGLAVAGEPVIEAGTFSAVVMMVVVTTMITPPALKWSFSRLPPLSEDGRGAGSR